MRSHDGMASFVLDSPKNVTIPLVTPVITWMILEGDENLHGSKPLGRYIPDNNQPANVKACSYVDMF